MVVGIDPGETVGIAAVDGDGLVWTRVTPVGRIPNPDLMHQLYELLNVVFAGAETVGVEHMPRFENVSFNVQDRVLGVVLAAAGHCGLGVRLVNPTRARKQVVGLGRPTRKDKRLQLERRYRQPLKPLSEHELDAIVIAQFTWDGRRSE